KPGHSNRGQRAPASPRPALAVGHSARRDRWGRDRSGPSRVAAAEDSGHTKSSASPSPSGRGSRPIGDLAPVRSPGGAVRRPSRLLGRLGAKLQMALTRYREAFAAPRLRNLPAAALRAVFREGYSLKELRSDVLAGAVVGVVALPLAMALSIAVGAAPQ